MSYKDSLVLLGSSSALKDAMVEHITENYIEYADNVKGGVLEAEQSHFPVFTDVTDIGTLVEIFKSYNAYVVYLHSKDYTDADTLALAKEHADLFCYTDDGTVDEKVNFINTFAGFWEQRFKVYLFKGGSDIPQEILDLPLYYPLEQLRCDIDSALPGYNSHIISRFIQAIVEEDGHYEFTPVTENCLFIWYAIMGEKVLHFLRKNAEVIGEIETLETVDELTKPLKRRVN